MATKLPKEPASSEITPEALYNSRRDWLRQTGMVVGTAALVGTGLHLLTDRGGKKGAAGPVASNTPPAAAPGTSPAPASPESPATTSSSDPPKAAQPKYDVPGEAQTSYDDIASYNNFYEFGTDKDEPAVNAHTLKTSPWKIEVDGEVSAPKTIDMDDIRKWFAVEDRVYRFRCVEAWSMVIPWQGFQLSHLIEKLNPTSKAKYVQFFTLLDPEQMPGQKVPALKWPYREGLRMDEAMHPLTMLATGLYGKPMPNQNGAPIRLVVPWKYGFKYIKSIVKIRFTENEPETSWKMSAPEEYGFYSNVNPEVDHPRWSQKTERRIGEFKRRKTLMFNGYEEQVAGLYKGMDLAKNY
jgi:methionine sulfoxide reductase catalytic subunit